MSLARARTAAGLAAISTKQQAAVAEDTAAPAEGAASTVLVREATQITSLHRGPSVELAAGAPYLMSALSRQVHALLSGLGRLQTRGRVGRLRLGTLGSEVTRGADSWIIGTITRDA